MGYFDFSYPTTDFHELNLDWILERIKEFETKIDNISNTIVSEANAYTDSQLQSIRSNFDEFVKNVETEVSDLDTKYADFISEVNRRLLIMDNKLASMQSTVDSTINVANDYTNRAIANNNDYIIDQTTKALATVTVLNYFTGERVSIQSMFNYLCKFHLEDAISVQELADAQKTVDDLIALNMTMTQLATNGKSIIIG